MASGTPGPLTLGLSERRTVASWAADCAERVLPLFEAHRASDPRPRDAIAAARAFAAGSLNVGEARRSAVEAHTAARAADDPVARAAARAAGHAAATAHMAAHARGVAYALLAVRLASGPDAVAPELAWQLDHASPEVREVLGRLPRARPGRSGLAALVAELDQQLVNRGGAARRGSGRSAPRS